MSRKIPEGYRKLGGNETIEKDDIVFYLHLQEWVSVGGSIGKTPNPTWSSFIFARPSLLPLLPSLTNEFSLLK
jgi:hypothetical protein